MTHARRTMAVTLVVAATTTLGTTTAMADDSKEPVVPPALVAKAQGGRLAAVPASRTTAAFSSATMARSMNVVASHSAYLRNNLTGMVMDPDTGLVTWSYRGGTLRMPASTQKLLTTYTVLHSMDTNRTLTTTVMQKAPSGSVFLRGGGDPTLGYKRLSALAWSTATNLKAAGRASVNVYADATYFAMRPSKAYGWSSATLGSDAQLVRGLALAGYRGQGDSSIAAAKVFATYLTRYGVKATVKGKTTTPSGSYQLATTSSASVAAMLSLMLNVSANDYAEFLLQQAAKANGYSPGWLGARANMRRVLSQGGIPISRLKAYDGSGLSRANRMPAETMAAVVRKLWNDPSDNATVFGWSAMPRSGQTGTLYNRFRDRTTSCADGRILAKTGTLRDVVGLAGVAQSVDGKNRIFVLLENGQTRTSSVRKAVDWLATKVVGC